MERKTHRKIATQRRHRPRRRRRRRHANKIASDTDVNIISVGPCFFPLYTAIRLLLLLLLLPPVFLIHFNVILPSLESILSPLIHLIEFPFFFPFALHCTDSATYYSIQHHSWHIFFSHSPLNLWFYLCFTQFVHCLTFEMKTIYFQTLVRSTGQQTVWRMTNFFWNHSLHFMISVDVVRRGNELPLNVTIVSLFYFKQKQKQKKKNNWWIPCTF